MKFDTLKFVGSSTLTLPVIGLDSESPFVLKGADGLSAPDVEVFYEDTAEEGAIRGRRRAVNRQVVVRLGLQAAWNVGQTPDELREIVYGLLTTKFDQQVVLQIVQNGSVIAQVKGDVSRVEAPIFAKDVEVQITLECESPYFTRPSGLYQTPARTLSGSQTILDLVNLGSAPVGFYLAMTLQEAPTGDVIFSDDAGSDGQFINLGQNWFSGDSIILDTRAKYRGIWKVPAGSAGITSEYRKSWLNDLKGDSSWMRLHAGTNRIRVNLTQFNWFALGAYWHIPAYWGV